MKKNIISFGLGIFLFVAYFSLAMGIDMNYPQGRWIGILPLTVPVHFDGPTWLLALCSGFLTSILLFTRFIIAVFAALVIGGIVWFCWCLIEEAYERRLTPPGKLDLRRSSNPPSVSVD